MLVVRCLRPAFALNPTMALKLRSLAPEDCASWDAFVDAHAHRTPFHLIAWKQTIEAVFPYEAHYLMATEAGRIRAVLPLFLVTNRLMGRVLLSTPFAVYGGILADSAEARDALAGHAADLARNSTVDYLELRNAYPEQRAGFTPVSRYVTFTHQTVRTDSEQLLADLSKKLRNMIRKSLKFSYSWRTTKDLRAFYELMARNYRRLGTPIFPRRFFAAILENFGPLVDLRETLLDGKVVAASMNFLYGGEMHTYYAASDRNALHAAPNNYMYFELLLWAARHGFARFDFGRSKFETGHFEFKRQWLTEMRELPYEVLLVNRQDMPNITPKNPKFKGALAVWARLPLPITKIAGPRLIGLFP
jgi:FemAB-related protein (PEP-CTERM system-associated)